MSALLNKAKRTRARETRHKRREEIIAAAAHLFARQPWTAVTLDYVGRRVGVGKGIASLHFPSKEELFLEVIKRELTAWFDATEQRLEQQGPPLSEDELVAWLARDLTGRTELTRLVALLHNVLEANIEAMSAQLFIDWLRKRAIRLATLLDERCHGFGPGDGAPFLRRLATVVVGLRQTAAPSGIFSVLLLDEELAPFHVDPADEMEVLIRRVLPSA